MQTFLDKAELSLAQKLRKVRSEPIGWWVAIWQPHGEQAHAIIENPKKINTAASLIDEGLGNPSNTELFICSNGTFIILGKGIKSQKIEYLNSALENMFTYADPTAIGYDPIRFENSFYDLSASINDFYRHFAAILADCERIDDEKFAELGILKQNLFPVVEQEQQEALKTLRKKRSGLNILFIEDDKSTLSLLRHLINSINESHNVICAENAKKGMELYFETAPDILFLDINLPDSSGLEVLKFLKKNDENSYIVMLTAEASENVVKEALGYGAEGFIKKPFSKKQFEKSLSTHANTRCKAI